MPNTREVKNRLRGVRKTQQITRAMKMVATVKLRHAQAALVNSRPYAEGMCSLAAELLTKIDQLPADNPFFARRAAKKILLVVVAADRGLCGSMNTNIFRMVMRALDDLGGAAQNAPRPEIELFLVGRKSKSFFSAHQNAQFHGPSYIIREAVAFSELDPAVLGRQCCELYRTGEIDRVEVFYNGLVSALQHHPVRLALFPLDFARMREQAGGAHGNVMFEPDCAEMLDDVVRAYIVSTIWKIMREAEVAEYAARMLMMDLATKNADDLIAAMQLKMNKLRQLAITSELADITTGAAALG